MSSRSKGTRFFPGVFIFFLTKIFFKSAQTTKLYSCKVKSNLHLGTVYMAR